MKKLSVSFIIPCFNEEKTIGKCIESVLNQTEKAFEIIVVNDGSTDSSKDIILNYKNKGVILVDLAKNTGNKSKAIEYALKKASGDLIAFTDADSIVDKDFVRVSLKHFENENVGAVAGKVISYKNNWLTSVRSLEYIVSQEIHKSGQAALGAVMVVPGSSGIFRAGVLKMIKFDHDTVTEDLDITLKTHKLKKKIIYEPKSLVYTNDPYNLKSYIRQSSRWYRGGFQNIVKHKDLLGKGWIGMFEIPFTILETLFFGMFFILSPIILIYWPMFVVWMYVVDFAILVLASLYGMIKMKRYDLFKVIPIMFFMRILNNIIYFWAFVMEVILRRKQMAWLRADR